MSDRIKLIKPEPVAVAIPPDLEAALAACGNTGYGRNSRPFTPEEDAAILKYYQIKRKDDLAKVFGCCAETLRKRYNVLIMREGQA